MARRGAGEGSIFKRADGIWVPGVRTWGDWLRLAVVVAMVVAVGAVGVQAEARQRG